MTVKFSREFIHDVWDEAAPLREAHYREIMPYKDIALNPNRALYMWMENAGVVRVFTVRDYDRLVGYQVLLVSRHLHFMDLLQAMQDGLFLHPSLRGRTIGYRFILWCDEQLKREGIQSVTQHSNHKHDFGHLLEHMEYELMDHIYVKRLDGGS
mgnify:CR=1 FL=1